MYKFDSLFTEKEKQTTNYHNLSIVLENMYNSIKRVQPNFQIDEAVAYANTSFGSNDYDTNGLYHKVSLGLTKKTWDRLTTREIVGVQPMNGPVGLYYALRYYANGMYGGVNNEELGFNKVDPTYTGSMSVSAAEVLGSNLSGYEGLGLGDGTNIKELDIKLEKKQAEAQTRKLKARFSTEIFQDVFAMHNANLKDQLWDGIAREIATEIDVEVIEKMATIATQQSLDFATIAGDNKSDKYNSFVAYVLNRANAIGKATNHGNGNFVIASSDISGVLESTPQFSVSMLADRQID